MGGAGSLAHEMAHAYSHEFWTLFIFTMANRKMKDVNKVNEGLTILIADQVNQQFVNRHPRQIIGDTGSGYDKSFTDRAGEFVKVAGGRERVFRAYFGGHLDFVPKKEGVNPEDAIVMGPRRFKWPFR